MTENSMANSKRINTDLQSIT